MPQHTHYSHSADETIKIAADLADTLLTTIQTPRVICLYGTLGMGKTVFARALIRSLCADQAIEVVSPTFTLVQQYDAPQDLIIHHYDLYRIEDPEEIMHLGWEEALDDGITIIEWPERLGAYKPPSTLDIVFSNVDTVTGQENHNTDRKIEIIDHGAD